MLLLSFADFFSKTAFPKDSFKNSFRMSNSLDPVGPGQSPNCFAKVFSRPQKSSLAKK